MFLSHLFVEGESVKPHLAPELDLQLVSIVELDGAAVGRRVLLDKESTELGEEDRVAHTLQVVDVNVRHPNVIHHVETEYSEYDCKKKTKIGHRPDTISQSMMNAELVRTVTYYKRQWTASPIPIKLLYNPRDFNYRA